jgi:uncharacterized protein YktB (UPF0637 family)
VKVKDVGTRRAVAVDVSADTFYVLIATRAKRFVAGTGENYDADICRLSAVGHSVEHFKVGLWAECVIDAWTIYRYFGNLAEALKENVFILLDCSPIVVAHDL